MMMMMHRYVKHQQIANVYKRAYYENNNKRYIFQL